MKNLSKIGEIAYTSAVLFAQAILYVIAYCREALSNALLFTMVLLINVSDISYVFRTCSTFWVVFWLFSCLCSVFLFWNRMRRKEILASIDARVMKLGGRNWKLIYSRSFGTSLYNAQKCAYDDETCEQLPLEVIHN